MPSSVKHKVGLNLKAAYHTLFETSSHLDISWIEANTEDYLELTGRKVETLQTVRRDYPLALHGSSLNIGCPDGVNIRYLQKLRELVDRVEPLFVSDHLCWTGYAEVNLHSLLPMPYTEDSVQILVNNIDFVQNVLERPLLLENVSTYISYTDDTMHEWDFIKEVSVRSGCLLLLDLNTVYSNAHHHSYNPRYYLNHIPMERVAQIHASGPNEYGEILYSTKETQVPPQIWELLKIIAPEVKHLPLLIERHEDNPELQSLQRDIAMAKHILENSYETERTAEPI